VLNGGALAFAGRPADLVAAAAGHTWELAAETQDASPPGFGVVAARPQVSGVLYRLVGSPPTHPIHGLRPVPPTLEDGYTWLFHRQEHPR
jgi:hypothetical protein